MKIDLKANEVVVKATDTEYFLRNIPISGKLILTNQRLYFKTHESDCEKYNLEILPAQMEEILPFNRGWFSKGGLTIVTKDGKQLRFVMKKRDEWGSVLNKIY